MQELTLEKIKILASRFHNSGQKWHFHILNPNCILNDRDDFALVLETPDQKAFVHYSNKAEKEMGEILVKLLHGTKVLENETLNPDYDTTHNAKNILDRISHLENKGIEWHHHCLFPECMFNENEGLYQLVLEDPENGNVLKSETETEPKNELKMIEILFFKKD